LGEVRARAVAGIRHPQSQTFALPAFPFPPFPPFRFPPFPHPRWRTPHGLVFGSPTARSAVQTQGNTAFKASQHEAALEAYGRAMAHVESMETLVRTSSNTISAAEV
jgi:hypothetical protein